MRTFVIGLILMVSAVAFAHPSPGVDQVCAQYPFTDMQTACLMKFRGKRVEQNVVALCKQYPYTDSQVSCLLDLADRFVDPAAEALCKQYPYTDTQKSCFVELANLRFDQNTIATCRQYPDTDSQKDCMKKLGDPARGPWQGSGSVADQVATALNSLRSGNAAQAEALLTDLNNDLARHPNLCQ